MPDDDLLSFQLAGWPIELAFNPLQPRIPKGLPGAGRWLSETGLHGGGLLARAKRALNETADDEGGIQAGEHAASPEITRWASTAAAHVPSLLGGGHEEFTGDVLVADKLQSPTELAALDWDGNMHLRSDVAYNLNLITNGDGAIRPEAGAIVLHELIHGDIGGIEDAGGLAPTHLRPEIYKDNMTAYQSLPVATIEEGFTELGATQHAGEFFQAMGIADRPTGFVKPDPSLDKAEWDAAKAITALNNFYTWKVMNGKGGQDGRDMLESLTLQMTGDEPYDLANVRDQVADMAKRFRPMDPALFDDAAAKITALQEAAAGHHLTAGEDAALRADPARIRANKAWGHYPQQTTAALDWVTNIAKASPGTSTTALADEINREGAAGKVAVMVDQVLRSQGVDPASVPPMQRTELEHAILDNWQGETAGMAAFTSAQRTASLIAGARAA